MKYSLKCEEKKRVQKNKENFNSFSLFNSHISFLLFISFLNFYLQIFMEDSSQMQIIIAEIFKWKKGYISWFTRIWFLNKHSVYFFLAKSTSRLIKS